MTTYASLTREMERLRKKMEGHEAKAKECWAEYVKLAREREKPQYSLGTPFTSPTPVCGYDERP